MTHYLKERYQKEIAPALEAAIGTDNVMQIPRITKVVVNIGLGEALDNPKSLDGAVEDLRVITGQQPIMTPVPEDPALAVSIAYAFGDDKSGPHDVGQADPPFDPPVAPRAEHPADGANGGHEPEADVTEETFDQVQFAHG